MSHWLHCNGCYSSPETVELPFYISSCSHIYCEKCVTPCTKECCKICKSQCTTLMLNSKIPKEVEALFADPVDLHQKLFKQLHQTLEFQKSHQRRLIRKFKEKIKAVERQNNEVRNILMQAQNLEREFMKLKEENHYLKFLLSKATNKYQPFKDPVLEPVHPLGDIQLLPANHSRLERIMSTSSPSTLVKLIQLERSYQVGQSRNVGGTSTNILNQPGRLLMRTPPSGGHLGTVGGMHHTPSSTGSKPFLTTPISIPRPIHLHKSE